MVRRRNNIVLLKRDSPHNVTLPNGRTFYAKYRRVTKEYLPGSTKIARTYKGRPVKIKKAKNIPPTYVQEISKKLLSKGINSIPSLKSKSESANSKAFW